MKSPLVYYATNTSYLDWGEIHLWRRGTEPYYEFRIENRYGSGELKLTEKDIQRLFSCLSSEVMNSKNLPRLAQRIDPDCLRLADEDT